MGAAHVPAQVCTFFADGRPVVANEPLLARHFAACHVAPAASNECAGAAAQHLHLHTWWTCVGTTRAGPRRPFSFLVPPPPAQLSAAPLALLAAAAPTPSSNSPSAPRTARTQGSRPQGAAHKHGGAAGHNLHTSKTCPRVQAGQRSGRNSCRWNLLLFRICKRTFLESSGRNGPG